MENESLRLELANHKRAAAAQEVRLKQRVAATELEVNEVRREAEEYQRQFAPQPGVCCPWKPGKF